MIPPVTQRPCSPVITHAISQPQSLHTLKSLGLFDDHYNLLFTPSQIPPISEKGQDRWNKLLDRNISNVKQSDYIGGLAKTLKEKGIEIQTYLRGGYAAYVACIDEYFAFLVAEFLASKGMQLTIEVQEAEEPHDVDLFDYVINNGIPATATHEYGLEFLKGLFKEKIPLLQKLIPETSPLFPYSEDYVLFTVGDDDFQTDRIIGRLNHPYLFTRDDIRIEIKDNKICTPESAGNFWQMVLHRSLKVVKTESWHEKDFRAGLAALQLVLDDHILMEDDCPLENIFRYAVSTGSEKIYTGAIDRAKLHCKKTSGFLLSALIAYSHADPHANMQILKDAVGEIPPLPSLYKLALLSTCYQTLYKAYWDYGLLILHWNDERIIFPKDFSLTSSDEPFSEIDKWILTSCSEKRPLCWVLDRELSLLERVLFELALQKRLTPLSESMKDALVEYLISDGRLNIAHLFHPWLQVENTPLSWIKALVTYSFKHGLKLWNSLNRPALEEVFGLIAWNYPSYSYNIIETDRIKLLKLIAKSPKLNPDLAKKIVIELIACDSPAHISTIDTLITEEHEDWFFNSNPSQERIEAVYLRTKNLNFLIRGITLPLLQKYKNAIKTFPETYIKLIKQFGAETLTKEWVSEFPLSERTDQALKFFTDYAERDRPLLDAACSLPGLNENNLIERLHLLRLPVFADQPFSKLLAFLKSNLSPEIKKEIFKNVPPLNSKEEAALQRWMKDNPLLSLELISHVTTSMAVQHLLYLKSARISSPLFDPLWKKVLPHADPNALLPFYQDRAWVRSVYGIEALAKTKEWASLVGADAILSRTELVNTPQLRLKLFLELHTGKKLDGDTEMYKCFHELAVSLLSSVEIEEEYKLYRFGILAKLFKMSVASKIHSVNPFSIMTTAVPFVPILVFKDGTFDPLFHLLKNLPPVDHGSEELTNQWNEDRNKFLHQWYGKVKTDYSIDQTEVIKVSPYPVIQASCSYTYQFKLITEQFIEARASKKEFQEEVQALIASLEQTSIEFQSHEDPCLNCVNDLLFFLRHKDKRACSYEAFKFLLHKRNSPFAQEQQKYLETRKNLEELILAKATLLINYKITYYQFFDATTDHIRSLFEAGPHNFHIQDPITDALEIEPLLLIDKIELQKSWQIILSCSTSPYNLYQAAKIKSYHLYAKSVLNETYIQNYLQSVIASLVVTQKTLAPEHIRSEIALLIHLTTHYLSEERGQLLVNVLKEKLGIKGPLTFASK